ncbi:hypothetical protein HRH59_12870 [Rheinheimera sp. YQF-2]|uniref:Uncharacterized protein n=1 Tax=Rheinheimera lutimaris TaxID=2740584 RepID=A0A7Y5EIE4_9GAMM|nr:hypothetical protein [Rheinheimera lutimaris]NRQ43440.1 hypothetical protein [Rheinheimera lutimaris]
MAKSKKFADFINDNGEYERVSIWKVRKKEQQAPGQWNVAKYYSTHRLEENKLRMTPSHTYNKRLNRNTHFFKYLAGQIENDNKGGDGGESMTHMAYKDAISRLKRTKLVFSHRKLSFDIEITKAELEKTILLNGRKFRLDVYIEFTSEHEYCLKWNGRMGIEVCRSNSLHLEKIEGLETLGIPVVQIRTHSKFEFNEEEHEDDEDQYNQHVDYLVKRFTQELRGMIYVDPQSVEYLQQCLARKDQEITSLNEKFNGLRDKANEIVKDKLAVIQQQVQQIADLNAKIATQNSQLKQLSQSNTKLKQATDEQHDLLLSALDAGFFSVRKLKAKIRKYLSLGLPNKH